MRTLRLSLVGTVTLALLGGLSGAVIAQSGEASELVTHVTGVVTNSWNDSTEEEWWLDPETVGHARGFKQHQNVDWSDPRLPRRKDTRLNFDMYHEGEFREVPVRGTHLLTGPYGYWTGTGSGFCDTDGECVAIDMLTGHEAYEGLNAALFAQTDGATGVTVWDGYIFEGEPLPMPEPLEPYGIE
jgi:hypothetical protein